jgi:GDP-L-fucose synthase
MAPTEEGEATGMNVLVTGGHGFVGKQVVPLLKEAGHTVAAVSRLDGVDLTDLDQTRKAFEQVRPQAVVNCAAHVGSLHYVSRHAATVVDDNMRLILNTFRALHEVCPESKLINPISNCSYPGEAQTHSEPDYWNGPVHPSVWSYGNTRRMITVVSDCYAQQHGMKVVNYFFSNAYGPGDYADPDKAHAVNGMILRMIDAQRKGAAEFEIWGTGKPEREWTYVNDMARMLVHAVDHEESQVAPINVAQNKAYAIRETAETIRDVLGYRGALVFNTKYQDGAPRKILDDRLFRRKYPDFKFTDMKEGIRQTVDYYKGLLEIPA